MGDYKGLLQKLELKNRTVKFFELTIPLVGSRAYDLDQQTVSSSSKNFELNQNRAWDVKYYICTAK